MDAFAEAGGTLGTGRTHGTEPGPIAGSLWSARARCDAAPDRGANPLPTGVRGFAGSRWTTVLMGTRPAVSNGMPEVGPGVGLERFELVALGDVHCTVDIVDQHTASIVLAALPEFPLQLEADNARRFVEAWRQRANLAAQPYEVRQEQREI